MIKAICEITLTVSKLGRAVNFYRNILGLQAIYETKEQVCFDAGGTEIILTIREDQERHRRGEPEIGFQVNDIEQAFQYLRDRVVHCIQPPQDSLPDRRTALFSDPDGNRIRLVQKK